MGGDAQRGECGGDFLPDEAGLAQAGDENRGVGIGALGQDFDGGVDVGGEAGAEAGDSGGFGAEDGFEEGLFGFEGGLVGHGERVHSRATAGDGGRGH